MHDFEKGNINHLWLLNRGMKTRKQKSTRTETSKRKVSSDVSPSTSLPPLVEGQLRCFLRVTISQILWTLQKPPPATFVRLRWWGESTDGTHFFPRDGSQALRKTTKTTAHFPIRCGPKQFTSYLTDMGFIVLEVLTKPDNLPIARAQVLGISHLSLSQPLSGFYTVLSPTSKKLGELHVSLHLEPLTEAYDNSTFRANKDEKSKGQQVPTVTISSQLRSHLVNFRGSDQQFQEDKGSSLENQMPNTNIPHKHQMAPNSSNQEICGQTTSDLLSVILERGNKLRNALVVSALKGDMSTPALKDSPLRLPKDNILLDCKSFSSPSETLFLQNIINAGSTFKPAKAAALISDSLDHPDTDNRAVDLLLGSPTPSPLVLWDGEEPFHGSAHSSVCVDSELSDPQYDHSLLENLFYKTPMLDVRESDPEAKDQKVSLHQQQVTQSAPEISRRSNSELQQSAKDVGVLSGLSSEQMTLLSLVRDVRVTIDSLTVPEDTTVRKSSSKWKAPRPITSKKCTYFIEYAFPADSHNRDRGRSAGQEVTRAVSSQVTGQEVNFHHLSVFPVHLTTATVNQWSETELIFKIYIRKSDQKKPVLIGKAIYLLNYLLQNKQLRQIVSLPVQNMEGDSEFCKVGPLKVSLELATDNRDLSSKKSKSKLAAGITPSPSSTAQRDDAGRGVLPAESRVNARSPDIPVKEPSSLPDLHTSAHISHHQVEGESEVLLHTLLMVPDGRNFSCGSMKAPNLYLNCKLFWSDAMAQSIISWGQANPSFHFVQVTPVALTSKLLERLKNNVMVIEMWQKTGSSGQDQLLGLVKLPLHQFYMSFRDPKIVRLLLQTQYPVLGVDCYMPVIDVFSGRCKGNLRVVLAMGKSEQIIALQRTRDKEYDSSSHFVRPVHLLDYQPQSQQSKVIAAQTEAMREHMFVIRVEKVKGLMPLQSTVWGEADCYVQYSFVSQDSTAEVDRNLIETGINLKQFRTTTTLCIPDPVFEHTETHVLQAPDGIPVQSLLLSSFSGQVLSSGGGVQFEVWCRYYYPNVRDQLVAKSILPLSKLCALVTMQRQHPSDAEMFSLPLFPRTDCPTGQHSELSGLLDVCIQYKNRLMGTEGLASDGMASRFVTLVVQVHRASGLQAAARLVAEQNESLNYFANVGVNAYVSVQLSFLDESEQRCTHAVARTFCPEFDHHMEIPCDLLLYSSNGETHSLAEELQEASAVFTLWNSDSHTVGEEFTCKSEDVMLGTVKIPLIDLIRKRTGISGWFGVNLQQEKRSSQHQHILVGGLDVSLRFAHHSDWEKVFKAAREVGWEITLSEVLGDEEAWAESTRSMTLTISMPRVWLPVHCLLLPGHSKLQRSTFCYFRYKFYEDNAFCSQMRHPSFGEVEEGLVTVTFQESRTIELGCSQPLMWYLREEKLEVQVWIAFTKDKAQRPRDTDRLVGSAFIDLSLFAKTSRQKPTISGVFPLFRRSAADLKGASLRVHITVVTGSVPVKNLAEQIDSDHQEVLLLEESDEVDQDVLPSKSQSKSSRTVPDITAIQYTETDLNGSFPVSVVVDRAMHLSLKGCPLAERSESSPCCCVSYVTADSSEVVSTAVIARTDCPVWDHQHQCRLSKQLLVDSQQSLVFKVWHKGEMDRVIGFASVDLSPLLWGFQSVCGWYNITDFSGRCHGQLKVSITPLMCVQELRGQRKPINEESTKESSAFSLSYHTTATYSSFPSHISQYPEQMISSPDHTRILFSDRTNEGNHHFEHMENVRLYHQSIQEQTAPPSGSSIFGDANPSSSFLISTLRKKLSELDNIQRYFSRKLSPPTVPFWSERDWSERDFSASKHENQRETDACQLLIKSKQLVGEVNSIITGLRGQHLEKIPSDPESSSAQDDSSGTLPEVPSLHRASNSSQEVFPLPSSVANILEDGTDSEPVEEAGRQSCQDSESESENKQGSDRNQHKEGCRLDSVGDDGDEDNDYDEVVIKPRPLNEVTSLTDKTSPWTSVLSDLDMEMISLESEEETNEADLSPDDDERFQIFNQQTPNCDEQQGCDRQDANRSAGDASEADCVDERTAQTEERRQEKESQTPINLSHGNSLLLHKQDATVTHDAPSSQDMQPQASNHTEVPNFFLPSHQLEASMRAIQLAPSFRDSLSDSDHTSLVHPRRPRHHMSPSSKKKETERIAKIFAARYNDYE